MPLLSTDIKVYKSENPSTDLSTGGGKINTTMELVDVVGALFANVDDAERLAGSTKWRKMFFKLCNNGVLPLVGARVFEDKDTDGIDTILFGLGTEEDTKGSGSPISTLYGSVALATTVSSGDTSIQVHLPKDVDGIANVANFFRINDTLRITNKATVSSTGNEEFPIITNVVVAGSLVTLTVSPPLVSGYSSSNTRVMNVLVIGDLVAHADAVSNDSTDGTFDISKVTCNNLSSVYADWTITFTSSSAFSLTSSIAGFSATVGNVTGTLAPSNAAYSLPYFSITSDAFGGVFVTGDVIAFQTTPANVPIWLKRIIPAGADPVAINRATFVLDGGTV